MLETASMVSMRMERARPSGKMTQDNIAATAEMPQVSNKSEVMRLRMTRPISCRTSACKLSLPSNKLTVTEREMTG